MAFSVIYGSFKIKFGFRHRIIPFQSAKNHKEKRVTIEPDRIVKFNLR